MGCGCKKHAKKEEASNTNSGKQQTAQNTQNTNKNK